MKTISKISLALVLLTTLGASSALADDQQLQNRLALQRAQADRQPRLQHHFNPKLSPSYVSAKKRPVSIAVYSGGRGVGERAKTRWEWRWNAHGERFLVAVPNR